MINEEFVGEYEESVKKVQSSNVDELQCPKMDIVRMRKGDEIILDINAVDLLFCNSIGLSHGCKYKESCKTYEILKNKK